MDMIQELKQEVQKVNRANKVFKVYRVKKVKKDLREHKVHRVHRVHKVPPDVHSVLLKYIIQSLKWRRIMLLMRLRLVNLY
jgi:ERCC4-type nuclease